MALVESSPGLSPDCRPESVAELASVTKLHPPREGVFDSGTKSYAQGDTSLRGEEIDWTLTVPENLAYDGLAVIVNGYTGIGQSSKAPREALADNGIATLSFSPARHGANWLEGVTNPQRVHAIAIKKVLSDARQDETVRKLFKREELEEGKLLLVPHSMGGLGASRFAETEAGSTDAIINLASVGFGHPTFRELLADIPKGSLPGVWHELIPSLIGGEIEASRRNIHDLRHYITKRRYPFEGLSCLLEDSRPRTARLRELGVFVAYQAYEHDILVRADDRVAEHVDHHEVMKNAGHLAPIRKAQAVAGRVRAILEAR